MHHIVAKTHLSCCGNEHVATIGKDVQGTLVQRVGQKERRSPLSLFRKEGSRWHLLG